VDLVAAEVFTGAVASMVEGFTAAVFVEQELDLAWASAWQVLMRPTGILTGTVTAITVRHMLIMAITKMRAVVIWCSSGSGRLTGGDFAQLESVTEPGTLFKERPVDERAASLKRLTLRLTGDRWQRLASRSVSAGIRLGKETDGSIPAAALETFFASWISA
jgi:hypothetical protein